MWKVHFVNFGYDSANQPQNLEDAVKVAKKAGFQSQIYDDKGEIVATWCPMTGLRFWARPQL